MSREPHSDGTQIHKNHSRVLYPSHLLQIPYLVTVPPAALAVAFVTAVAAVSSSYPEIQYYGLEALYNATGGEQWTTSTGWRNRASGVCGWYAVTCDNDSGNVTGLSLVNNGLSGNLTATGKMFFDISSLREVDLSNNRLVGPVPLRLGLMPGLEVLDLSRNQLSSFPEAWGSAATSLQHLTLSFNNISGRLPWTWLELNDSTPAGTTAYPIVHSQEVSNWLPNLRTLILGHNKITMTVYQALQSVASWASLQMLDLSENALTGTLEGAFDLYYCEESTNSGVCRTAGFKVGASTLTVLLLSSNYISGGLTEIVETLPLSLSVLTASDNLLEGLVPEEFSQLVVFFADGNDWLNGTSLPSFASYSNSTAVTAETGNLTCPIISGRNSNLHDTGEGGGVYVRLKLDPSYLGYRHCVCKKGTEGNARVGCQPCPKATYRGAGVDDLFSSPSCAACPANAGTATAGADSVSECKCNAGFYDALAGKGDSGTSCTACPSGSVGWVSSGATSVTSCSCPEGTYLDADAQTCADCPAGTYKSSMGNDLDLCVPCAEGTYSRATRQTTSVACTPCEAGTYSTAIGATSSLQCLPCPRGTFSAVTGLFWSEMCATCPAGYYQDAEGATDAGFCEPCRAGTYSTDIGASSEDSCRWCADGLYSLEASHDCGTSLTNSRRTLVIYLVVGSSTLAGITISYYTWQKKYTKKRKLMVDRRTETPLKMARAKRTAQLWAVMFHSLETIDVITGNALFIYLLERGTIGGFVLYVYWTVVSVGLALNIYRIYKVLWDRFFLTKISVAQNVDKEGKPVLVVSQPGRSKIDRRIMTSDDAKMVLELVKILKHLQVNKFKVLLAVMMDLPLTILNLDILWTEDPGLIQSRLFLTSLIIAVFSAGKISTLIEYHLELRQRKRKLERLLMVELKSSQNWQANEGDAWDDAGSGSIGGEEEGDCFEHGYPETLLQFHGETMRNILIEGPKEDLGRRSKGETVRRYLHLTTGRLSPKPGGERTNRGGTGGSGGRGSGRGRGRSLGSGSRTPSPKRPGRVVGVKATGAGRGHEEAGGGGSPGQTATPAHSG